MSQLLYSTTYKKPGVYIGQIIEPSADSIGTASRIPVMLGKGSRYAQASNKAVVRAYVYEEELEDITSSAPYIATLKHAALKDQSRAELVRKSDGYVIPDVKWQFGDDAQSIIISEDVYMVDDEYTLSYQSTDRTVLDPTPVLDIISIGSCGNSVSTNNFVENRDYYIIMNLDNLKKKDGNDFVNTTDLEFDPRYENTSLYPVFSADKEWAVVNADAYNGIDNLEFNFTVEAGTTDNTKKLVDATSGITIDNMTEGTFYAVGTGDLANVKVAITNFESATGTVKVTVAAKKIFPTAKDNRKVNITVTNATITKYNSSVSSDNFVLDVADYHSDSFTLELTATVTAEKIELKDAGNTIDVEITQINTEYALDNSAYPGVTISAKSLTGIEDGATVTIEVEAAERVYNIYYASNTPEGGFGTVQSEGDRIILPGNIILKINTTLVENAKYSFELTNTNTIDWNLTLKVSQYFRADSVYRDVNGTKTGNIGAYYVILNGVPLDTPTSEAVEVELVTGTPYAMVSYPAGSANEGRKPQNFSISYEYAGNEPNPGDTYYLTTKHIRPDNMFNKVIFISSRAEGELLLAPSTSKNDLYIANEIAWDEIGTRTGYQIAYIQIKDSDDDGVLSSADVQAAIDALATSKKVTDYCLLGNFEYLPKLLAANEAGNDPFECHENEVWVGAPVGTEVGDINEEGSLAYIAQSTLHVQGNENPAHGTRIMVASTEATKKITLEGNIEQSIQLDGSFVAWGLACHRSRMKPADSIMREVLTAFDSMQVYDDMNDIKLGQNQIVYFSKVSDGMYRVEEDFTTDKYSFEFSIEQITSQRLQVARDIRAFMNDSLIGYTPDTPQTGIQTITSFLVTGLNQKIKEGVISQYLDDKKMPRPLDPAKDIFVTNVKNNPTQYQFGYGFYTKKVMKVLFGSYVVDKNFVDTGLGN